MTFAQDIDWLDDVVGQVLDEVAVTYQPAAGGSYGLAGMFDRDYVEQSPYESALDNRGPSVFLAGAQIELLPVDPRHDRPTLSISGQLYQVIKVINDGPTGRGRRLFLSEVG